MFSNTVDPKKGVGFKFLPGNLSILMQSTNVGRIEQDIYSRVDIQIEKTKIQFTDYPKKARHDILKDMKFWL